MATAHTVTGTASAAAALSALLELGDAADRHSLPSLGYLHAIHVFPQVDIVRAAKQARIYFVTGPRLLHTLRASTTTAKAAALALGITESDLPERVAALSVASKDAHRRALKLREALAEYQGRDFVASLPPGDPASGLLELNDESTHDLDHVKLVIARAIAGLGSRSYLLGAVSSLPSSAQHASIILFAGDPKRLAAIGAQLRAQFGSRWRGGGKDRLQGKIEGHLTSADVSVLRSLTVESPA